MARPASVIALNLGATWFRGIQHLSPFFFLLFSLFEKKQSGETQGSATMRTVRAAPSGAVAVAIGHRWWRARQRVQRWCPVPDIDRRRTLPDPDQKKEEEKKEDAGVCLVAMGKGQKWVRGLFFFFFFPFAFPTSLAQARDGISFGLSGSLKKVIEITYWEVVRGERVRDLWQQDLQSF